MASTWLTKIRSLATAKELRSALHSRLNVGVAAVAAATVVGGGAAMAVLPTMDSEPIMAVPGDSFRAAIVDTEFSDLGAAASRDLGRATRSTARPALTAPAGLSADQQKALKNGGKIAKIASSGKPGTMWTTSSLRVRATPSSTGKEVSMLSEGAKVSTTGWKNDGWVEVTIDNKSRWVSGEYLTDTEPSAQQAATGSETSRSGSSKSGGSSRTARTDGPAPTGGSGSCRTQLPGLTSRAHTLHNAICANYPSVSSYGGVRPDPYPAHPSGRAIDAMIPNWSSSSGNALGWSMANWLRANASTYNIDEIIFDQKIWTRQRAGEGWRMMSDRGSANANHRNHVHVAVR
ncbi:SH3 domain-containing protein [Enemella sp. A6]|uniref:SH3 domain-containing protein n=1 Tax=Enemella sp. A6 TaxID=3440152 RepID=UPI003EB6B7D7